MGIKEKHMKPKMNGNAKTYPTVWLLFINLENADAFSAFLAMIKPSLSTPCTISFITQVHSHEKCTCAVLYLFTVLIRVYSKSFFASAYVLSAASSAVMSPATTCWM